MTGSIERLRTHVRAALADAHISQAEACRRLGVSTKHLSMMLTGRSVLTLDWADRLLGLCGMALLIGIDRGDNAKAERHTVDTITSDALDALYEQMEAAQQTELARQLATCDKAFASATLRAARAGAAIERVRALCNGEWYGITGDAFLAALDQAQQPTTPETPTQGDASVHWTCAHCAEPITGTDWTWEAGQDPAVSVWDKPRFHVDRAECQAAAGYPGQPTT